MMSLARSSNSRIPSLLEYARVFFKMTYGSGYEVFPWHLKIADCLTNLFLKKSERNVIICMPPRFGKSELGIKIWITYCLAFIPDCNFIIASATLKLARDHVTAIRDTLKTDWFRRCFPLGASFQKEVVVQNNKKKTSYNLTTTARSDFFETVQGGSVQGVGLGGTITGFAAGKKRSQQNAKIFGGAVICDDLTREQDYLSHNKRDLAYNWFKSTIKSRRNTSTTPIILIMQRLHYDDLVGRLLKEEPTEWDVIKVPAFNEETQTSNWESTISTKELLKLKISKAPLDEYVFHAKYQQEPPYDMCTLVKPSWWHYYDRKDLSSLGIISRIITADTAYKSKENNDETVLQLWGFAPGKAYLLDMLHGRFEFPELLQRSKLFWKRHNVFFGGRQLDYFYIEDKASGPSLVQALCREGVKATYWNPDPKDKVSRLLYATKFIANDQVFLPQNEKISQELVEQCAIFTGDNTVHDDMVDAMTMGLLIGRRFLE